MFNGKDSLITCKSGLTSPLCELPIIGRPIGGPLEGGDCLDCLLTMAPGEGQGEALWG